MKKFAVIKFLVFTLSVLLFTGCLTNPITGRIGPSWSVPIGVPIASNTISLADIAKEQDIVDIQDDYFVFHQAGEYSVGLADYFEFVSQNTILKLDSPIELEGNRIEAQISMKDLDLDFDDLGIFEALSFNEGTFIISFPNNSKWKTESISIDSQDLSVQENNLAGVTIEKDSQITVVAAANGQSNLPDEIKVTFKDTQLASFSGKLKPVTISASDLGIDVDLDLEVPDAVEDMLTGLEWIDVSLSLAINNPTGLKIDVDDLKLNILGQTDTNILSFKDATKRTIGTTTQYIFQPKNDPNDPIMRAIKSAPQGISLEGELKIGDSTTREVKFENLDFSFEVDLSSSFAFDIDAIESITVGPTEIEADKNLADDLDKYTKEASIHANVYNNFPVGVNFELLLSEKEDQWTNATPIKIGNIAPGGEKNELVFSVNESIRDILHAGGYSKVVITLLGDGSKEYSIKTTDNIKFIIWAEVEAKINQ